MKILAHKHLHLVTFTINVRFNCTLVCIYDTVYFYRSYDVDCVNTCCQKNCYARAFVIFKQKSQIITTAHCTHRKTSRNPDQPLFMKKPKSNFCIIKLRDPPRDFGPTLLVLFHTVELTLLQLFSGTFSTNFHNLDFTLVLVFQFI